MGCFGGEISKVAIKILQRGFARDNPVDKTKKMCHYENDTVDSNSQNEETESYFYVDLMTWYFNVKILLLLCEVLWTTVLGTASAGFTKTHLKFLASMTPPLTASFALVAPNENQTTIRCFMLSFPWLPPFWFHLLCGTMKI